jgi:hypothetical protein
VEEEGEKGQEDMRMGMGFGIQDRIYKKEERGRTHVIHHTPYCSQLECWTVSDG